MNVGKTGATKKTRTRRLNKHTVHGSINCAAAAAAVAAYSHHGYDTAGVQTRIDFHRRKHSIIIVKLFIHSDLLPSHSKQFSTFACYDSKQYVSPRSLWRSERLRNIVRQASFFTGFVFLIPVYRPAGTRHSKKNKKNSGLPKVVCIRTSIYCRKEVGGVQEQNNKNNPKSTTRRRKTHSSSIRHDGVAAAASPSSRETTYE